MDLNDTLFDKEHIIFDLDVTDQAAAFQALASKAYELGCTTDTAALVQGFENRERESTTGFEDGFAIPHARIAAVTKPAIIMARFKTPVEWNALDGGKIVVALALVIPEAQSSTNYLDILSNVSRKLLDSKFRNTLKTSQDPAEIISAVLSKKAEIKNNITPNSNITIVGVSACATGVAHTYMARDSLLEAGQKLNWNVYVETQGQKGPEFNLTDEQIANANAVILATDIAVDTDRFVGKKILQMGTKEVMKDPVQALQKSLAKGKVLTEAGGSVGSFTTSKSGRSGVKHIMSGVSYMIPFIVFAGILFAITTGVGKIIYGHDLNLGGTFDYKTQTLTWKTGVHNEIIHSISGYGIYALVILNDIANYGFTIFMPIMGAYIAYSIAGRAAIAPALITTWVANDPNAWFKYGPFIQYGDAMKGLSIFGALIMGFAAGYAVKWVNTWRVHKYVKPIMPIIIIPLFVTVIIAGVWSFLLGDLLGILMGWFYDGLYQAEQNQGAAIAVGLLIGLIAGIDMGGPINKIASFGATSLILIDGGKAMGAASASFAIAPMGAGIATLIFKRRFKDDQAIGINAVILGFMGISEGAIPFAVKYTWAAIIPNIICSGIAGMFAALFQVSGWVGAWGGPIIAIFGGVTTWGMSYIGILWYFIAIIIGVACHVIMFRILVEVRDRGGFKKVNFKNLFKLNSASTSERRAKANTIRK